MHGLARGLILVEQVSAVQDHIDVMFFSKTHDFVECLPAVIAPYWITLIVAHMTIRGYENPDSVRSYQIVSGISSQCSSVPVPLGAARGGIVEVAQSIYFVDCM